VRPTLRRLIESTLISLDGVIESPERWAPFDEEATQLAIRISLDPEVVQADEPRALGGGGTGPAPTQYALAAIGSCAAITYGYWSYKLGTPIDLLRVDVQGDIDLRGFLGLRDGIRPGFGEVRIRAMVSGPEPVRRYEELQRAVARHSPVRDMFTNRVPVTSTIAVV
jgi:uncharacterized OsmC-like protein